MPNLNFTVQGAEPQPFAAAPLLIFKLGLSNTDVGEPIQTVALRCQLQLEVTHRRYSASEQERLLDLFGEPARWGQTLRTMLWTHTSVVVTPFTESTVVEMPVPCTFDFNIAATKYFAALEDGEVPVCLQFSGTVFYANPNGGLQVAQIPWDKETRYRLPVKIWQEMMDIYYPNSAWLCLRRDIFERLHQYKMQQGLPTWERTLETLLPPQEQKR